MNVRKPVDYSTMFAALAKLIAAELPQMKLYCEIGRIVSSRPEKGAAVAAAEYLCSEYPVSPRNLRRMREFYHTYENAPEVMAEAMSISWTQNVVIFEADLTHQERLWYIRAVRQFGWAKLVLQKKIAEKAYLEISFDLSDTVCYAEGNRDSNNAMTQNKQCQGTGKSGLGNCISPLLSMFHPAFIHSENYPVPLLVRRRRRWFMGAVHGTGPPRCGSLWQALRWENKACQPQLVSRSGELPTRPLRL